MTTRIDLEFGSKYAVDGPLETPRGPTPRIRAVWFVERGEQPDRCQPILLILRRRADSPAGRIARFDD